MSSTISHSPYPKPAATGAIFALIGLAMLSSIAVLLSVDDPVHMKFLIEDSGPVQMTGQFAIGTAFGLCLLTAIFDSKRRGAFIMLSYLLMFYFLREADYHYKVSEYAKATQFKRFYLHDMIPLSTKLFMASIVILFLVTLVKYLRQEKATFIQSLHTRLPWALCCAVWFFVFGLSQTIDQVPIFHTVTGQVFEEVFEASAEVIALTAVILFRLQVWHDQRLPGS
ncbi:MAG: hypothetical protein ABJK20_11280 [Halieaceae bacterium]